MAAQALTIQLPVLLFEHLSRRAQQTRRSVEAELVDAAMAGLAEEASELPGDLAEAVAPLRLLDDEALWRAARSHLPEEAGGTLEALHHKRDEEGLSAQEGEQLAALLRQYERAMLIRAEAAALLKQRGHEVSSLLHAR